MLPFRPGQPVRCVSTRDRRPTKAGEKGVAIPVDQHLREGCTYYVRKCGYYDDFSSVPMVWLEGINRSGFGWDDVPFMASRFEKESD